MNMKNFEKAIASFELGKGPHYVLLLHGYPLSPHDVRELGEHLAADGFHIIAPLLPGFGKNYEYLNEHSDWREWVAEIDHQIELLKKNDIENIFVGGFSLGGTMTLWTAIHHPEVKALAPICGPVYVKGMLKWLIPIVKKFTKYVTIEGELDVKDPILEELNRRYDKVVLKAIHSELKLFKHVRNNLHKITQPIMICQGKKDSNIPEDTMDIIYENISSQDKQIKWYENSGHFLPYDVDKEELFSDVSAFFKQFI